MLFRSHGCDELDHLEACHLLAELYEEGVGVRRNKTRAVELLLRVDSPESVFKAFKLTKNPALLKLAAEYGQQDAQYRLGLKLMRTAQDEAVMWLHRAALNFHKPAQTYLRRLGINNEYPTGELGTNEGTEL